MFWDSHEIDYSSNPNLYDTYDGESKGRTKSTKSYYRLEKFERVNCVSFQEYHDKRHIESSHENDEAI